MDAYKDTKKEDAGKLIEIEMEEEIEENYNRKCRYAETEEQRNKKDE